jgi:PAS domain S-box-containing protein
MLKTKPTLAGILLLLIFISASVALVLKYVAAEKQRDLKDWQARLSIMAESQQHSVDDWFDQQLVLLQTLAENPLIQLYASQLTSGEDQDETMRGQLGHMRNLINAAADRAGVFTPINRIRANVDTRIDDGLALINTDGLILATRYFPRDDSSVAAAYQQVSRDARAYVSMIFQREQSGEPRIIIAVPVNSVQSLDASDVRAVVVAMINPENSLYPLLAKEWLTTHSEESLLVSDRGRFSYLSPLAEGYPPFYLPGGETAASQSVAKDGDMVVAMDYRGVDVLATARPLRHTPMMLVQKINVREALAESAAHQQFILTVFLLLVFLLALTFIAIWRHATSVRLQKAKSRLEARAALLNAIGDSINDHIFLLDHRNKLVFINDSLARSFDITDTDVRGKSLNHVFNNDITDRLLAQVPDDISQEVRNREMRLQLADKRHDYHISVVPLRHPDYNRSHLFVMHDITELKDAQGRHNRLLDRIIATLVQAIDRHDPHCAHHSERTREVAIAIAEAMGMPRERINTLAMAAQLANIGKLYVPSEVLTTTDTLTEAQEVQLRRSVDHGIEILKGLEFDGPVIDFVSQKNECLDGSGYPAGLSGEEILQESRILAIAKAFVAITSSRAYRPGKPIREALDILISEADTCYDRHVIAALFHIAENYADWHQWQHIADDGD